MAELIRLDERGHLLIATFDDGTRKTAFRVAGAGWIVSQAGGSGPGPDPDPGPAGEWAWMFKPTPYTEGGDMPAPGTQDAEWAEYGPRSGIGVGNFHEGIDFGYGTALAGADVKCAGPGVVRTTNLESGYGNIARVDHPDGTSTNYCHLASFSVAVGATVEAGTVLGIVGGTGGVPAHLHFECHNALSNAQIPNTSDNGNPRTAVNPRTYMAARL